MNSRAFVISRTFTFAQIILAAFFVQFWCSTVQAAKVSVSLSELSQAIDSLSEQPDALRRMALQKIQDELNEADLVLNAGQLLISDTRNDIDTGSGCNRTEIRTVTTRIALLGDTRLDLTLDSLNDPILLNIELAALISADGRAKQNFGFRLGSCQDLGADNFTFSATGDAQLSLQLQLRLNPILDESRQQLVLRPVVQLSGSLSIQNIRTDVDDSLLSSVLEHVLEDQIDDALDNARLTSTILELEQNLKQALDEELDNGLITLELPSPSDEQISSLYRLLSPEGDFGLSLGFLRTHRLELLAALVLGDDEEISRLLSSAAQCEAAGILQTSLTHRPVYQLSSNGCEASQIPSMDTSDATTWYADPVCQMPLEYYSNSTVEFCTEFLDTQRLGNAASNVEQLERWTLSPGTRFDIGALPLTDKQQPFTRRVNYKTVDTMQGECRLEMRIHSLNPLHTVSGSLNADDDEASVQIAAGAASETALMANPSRALIAFHGGSWQRRSSGALGIESFATQFANEGFVVFAPFYRLIGTSEGNLACNNATLEQVLEDANDALDWVQHNGSRFGVTGNPVLFGQSAGGHLAGVLSVERPTEVSSAVLFYAPTDFTDFARQLIEGEIDTVTGQRILEAVLGEQLETLDTNLPLIQRNSLPARIVDEAIEVPPLFMLHGKQDTVLPFEQSVRLCNALAGDPDAGPASPVEESATMQAASGEESSLRRVVECDAQGSQLHLISEGEHALDLCIAEELCLAGSPASAEMVEDSIAAMLDWVKQNNARALDDQINLSSGGGSMSLLTLLFIWLAAMYSRFVRLASNPLSARIDVATAPAR